MVTRRTWFALAGATVGGVLLEGCNPSTTSIVTPGSPRLSARPRQLAMPTTSGRITIDDLWVSAVLYVPASVVDLAMAPLVVFLHGALRTVEYFVEAFQPGADANGVIVLAPYANVRTWDAIGTGRFGPDIVGINTALDWVFTRWPIDPARIVLSGFSDGGTYTLALGRANGDLFCRVAAYSPGFLLDVDPVGKPPILITHGTNDTVLPYSNSSEHIVPALERAGYQVDFRSFAGPHAVLLSAANEVMRDLAGARSTDGVRSD